MLKGWSRSENKNKAKGEKHSRDDVTVLRFSGFMQIGGEETQRFLMPEMAMTGSEPSKRTLPMTESLASAQ